MKLALLPSCPQNGLIENEKSKENEMCEKGILTGCVPWLLDKIERYCPAMVGRQRRRKVFESVRLDQSISEAINSRNDCHWSHTLSRVSKLDNQPREGS